MSTLFLIVLFSMVIAFFIIPVKEEKKEIKVKVDSNNKWKMPNVFWDEFNWLSLKIYHMTREDADDVQHKINQFIYKYQEFADFHTFNDRVGILLDDYQKRVQLLLKHKNKNNGTSTEL